MVIIDNSGANNVALTLNENTTASAPEYLFEATAKDTNVKVTIDPLTVIESNERWDLVELDGTLFKSKQYSYQVTEKTESKIVERGLLNALDQPRTSGWDSFPQYDEQDDETRGRQKED